MTKHQKQERPGAKTGGRLASWAACFIFLALLFLYYRNHAVFLEGMRILF